MIRTIINGLCMALADSVPGVSGGTVAFIMGFYDKFIQSTNDIFYARGEKRKQALFYLIKFGIGWIAGMISAALILTSAFEKHIHGVSSLFFGFIIASIPMLIREERKSFGLKPKYFIFLGIGIAVVVTITLLNKFSFVSGVNFAQLSLPLAIYIFVGGVVSTAAMFLPGISGSTLLLVLGLYIPVMTAGRGLLSLHISYLPGMAIFTAGIIVGALTIVKIIQVCLERFRAQTMFLILGLMIGSLFAIVMGPSTLEVPKEILSIHNFNWIAFFIGIGLIALLQFMGTRKDSESAT